MGEKRPISYTEKEKKGSEKGISIHLMEEGRMGIFRKTDDLEISSL